MVKDYSEGYGYKHINTVKEKIKYGVQSNALGLTTVISTQSPPYFSQQKPAVFWAVCLLYL